MTLCQSVRYTYGIYAIYFLLCGISSASAEDIVQEHGSLTISKASIEPEGRALFNPRVEYSNQWLPVGHSDPLKNDPTFDYVPPTLGSVRYWSEENSSKTGNGNNLTGKATGKDEILLLGAPVEHSMNLQSNHLSQTETKVAAAAPPPAVSANRRSSPYYPPEPSRHLTPPPLQSYTTFDKSGFPSDHNYYASPSNYWGNELPVMHPNDAYSEESASYVTVIRPKVNPHPYASTIYNKNTRGSIYHLAANINSLEPVEKKPHWVHSLLQKEITYPVQQTTPQVILAYSPHIYESQSTKMTTNTVDHLKLNATSMEVTTTMPTTTTTPPTPTTTSNAIYSYHNQPALPVRRPMYLIIQGHSKVKTYGNNNNNGNKTEKHEPKMVPIIPTDDPIVKHVVSSNANVGEFQVKHLHKTQANEVKSKTTTSTSNKATKTKVTTPMVSLLSLLDSSLASFGMGEKESKSKFNDVKKSNDRIATSTIRLSTFFGPTTINPIE